ncbi:MAG: chorismate-binding protein [Prevotella sp.]|nr:chorismate-binding protein [Prevotella sp.]
MDESFALYRLPHAATFHVVRQQAGLPRQFLRYEDLTNVQGFVFAPFSADAETPIVLIEGTHEVCSIPMPSEAGLADVPSAFLPSACMEEQAGAWPFALFHRQLLSEQFRKIVLSRVVELPFCLSNDAEKARNRHSLARSEAEKYEAMLRLFFRACNLYPRMMIALVATPQTGVWLTATPEVLLEEENNMFHTMALAGTQNMGRGEWKENEVAWDDKNIKEQRYVATYIARCLKPFAHDIDEEGPYTQRAGHLAHLRSDFYFQMNDRRLLGKLLATLHPTPAVCGLPKQETLGFIQRNEPRRRRYYSGFCGPLDCEKGTHLYVTLRCMELTKTAYRLYAGGGLLKDSMQKKEWDETEAKLDTMRRLLKE